MHDLRSALRALVATPVVSLVAIVSLALGIGANTPILRAMNTHARRPARRRTGGWSLLLVVVMGMAAAGQSRDQESIRALHRTILTIDSHVDTPMRLPTYDIGKRHPLGIGMVDLPRMEDGGVVGITFVLPFLKREVTIADVSREIQALNDRVMAKGGWPALKPDEAAAFQKDLREIKYRYPQAWASVKDVVDHIDHVVRTIGIDHVGIGSDFDGGGYLSDCRDVSEYLSLTAELVRRGYSEADIRKIWGGNYLRVLRRVQELATPRAPTPNG